MTKYNSDTHMKLYRHENNSEEESRRTQSKRVY